MSPFLALAMVLELSFWPGKNAARDRRVLVIRPHPCGEVAVARVSALPRPGTRGPIEPEEVIEWSKAGRIIRKWPMPVDARPLAVQGDRLLVVDEAGLMLWISPAGSFAVHRSIAEPPDATDTPCPRQSQTGSSYTVCRLLPDLGSGQRRMVQFESPCT